MIRTAWVFVVGFVLTVWYGSGILWRSAFRSRRLACACRRNPRAWARGILRAAGVDVHLEGIERLDPDRPWILVANHVSWFDVFVLAAHVPSEYRFVAKKELESVPVFGPAWRACGHVSLDRQDRTSAIRSLEEVGRRVREEKLTVILFPEGTRSPGGELRPFKKGAFVLALQVGVPVLPAAIVGTREVMPKGAWTIRPGTVRVRFGEPIPVEGMGHEDRDVLGERARAAVAALHETAGTPLSPDGDRGQL